MSRAAALSVVSHLLDTGYTPAMAAAETCMGATSPAPGYHVARGRIRVPLIDGETFSYSELAKEIVSSFGVQGDLFGNADKPEGKQ